MKKISIISLVFITMLFLVYFAALAQNEGELLQSALSSYQAGDLNASQEALEKARLLLWNKAPMKMVNPVFTEGEAQSYGYYTKRLQISLLPTKNYLFMLSQKIIPSEKRVELSIFTLPLILTFMTTKVTLLEARSPFLIFGM